MQRNLIRREFDFDVDENMSLFKAVYDDLDVCNAVDECIRSRFGEIKKYAVRLLKGKWKALTKLPSLDILSAVALSLSTTKKRFERLGVSEKIFFDTMDDVRIWGEDCRRQFCEIGLREINWIRLHIGCEIFKIGRLQYQKSRYYLSANAAGKIRFGEKCFNIHIPRGGRLDKDSCISSIKDAVFVLGKVFPKIRTDVMMCHSWMLGKSNSKFINEKSNIANFAEMFEIVGESDGASEHFRWIFDMNIDDAVLQNNKKDLGYYYDLSDFSPKTSLQASAKEYIMKGGELKDGKGVIFTDEVLGK